MGQTICGSQLSEHEKAEILKNRILDEELRQRQHEEDQKVKLLLLGAGESGKSTLFKQMKIKYREPYSDTELMESRPNIWRNILENFRFLLTAAEEQNRSFGGLEDLKAKFFEEYEVAQPLTPEIGREISQLWNCKAVQETWEERSRFQLLDALEYFCDKENIERISSETYKPETLDFLYSRVRSTGMVEQSFIIQNVEFVILDVGGQRSERKKWIACFDDVTAILFVAAINEFDQVLWEDSRTNRMQEALSLFKSTLKFRVFRDTPVILFLNKVDLFNRKIADLHRKHVNLDSYFPELKLGSNYSEEEASKKVLERIKFNFESLTTEGRVYSHFVTATDTANVRKILDSVTQIVLTRLVHNTFYH